MATIRRSIPIARPAPAVWAAVADVGAVHTRLAQGFVTDTRLEGDTRVVTFEGGTVARELIVDVDPAARRVAYAVIESPLGMRHHHATMQVVADGSESCRLEWVVDLSPDEAAPTISGMVDIGAVAMQRTLSSIDADELEGGSAMSIALEAVTFDCADALVLARFWSAVLDHPVDDGATDAFAAIGLSDDNKLRPAWCFVQVPEPKVAKNRCHPDLLAADQEAAVARAVSAGATRVADIEESGTRWTTLTDPEGNELDIVAG